MKLRTLALTICCIASGPIQASAGLTSVGVDPGQPNNPQAEPTLAQVAPVPNAAANNAPGTATTSIAGVPVSAQQAGGGAANTAGTGPGGAAGSSSAAPPRVIVPPPPPDPSTLPVSVIRPLNKTPAPTPAPAADAGAAEAAAAPVSNEPRPAAVTPRQHAGMPVPAAAPVSPRGNVPSAPARTEEPARTAAEPDIPADASSSSFIFYSGLGLAAVIALLSLAAFFRGSSDEAGKPRSL